MRMRLMVGGGKVCVLKKKGLIVEGLVLPLWFLCLGPQFVGLSVVLKKMCVRAVL